MADSEPPVDPASLESPESAAQTLAEALAQAEACKVAGNDYLKQGNKSGFEAAKEQYSQGIKTLEAAATQVHTVKGALSDETRAQGGMMLSMLFSNRSHVKLMLKDFPGSVDDARRSFQLNPMNIKAYWRAAKASLGLQLYKNAKEFCDLGLGIDATHADLQKLQELCAAKLEGQQAARRAAHRDAGEFSAEEAQQIQQRAGELQQRLQLCTEQLNESKREIARTGFIQKALETIGAEERVYRKIGRCFLQAPRDELATELTEHVRKLEEETAPRLSAQRVELEARSKEAEDELRAMVSAFKQQQQQQAAA